MSVLYSHSQYSQNGWGWQGVLGPFGPTPAQVGCPGPYPGVYWRSPSRRLHNPCQCSVTHRVIKCFLMVRQTLSCSTLCPMPLVLALHTTKMILWRSLWMAAQPSVLWAAPPSSVSAANLLRMCSAPSSWSLMMLYPGLGPVLTPGVQH